ncbi:MFS transporter [Amycolatopsis sp. NPDC005232]|uniref:MFS transporter n=1 Tax=Amycolatopsis sp. NPDC005232 TaxID=3157027 RepID=UPI0033B5C235
MPAPTFDWSLSHTTIPRRVMAIVAIACLAVVFDGYDLQALAYSLPTIVKEWGIAPVQAGLLGSYAFVGLAIGAVGLGAIGDRWGRKRALVAGILIFGLFMGTAGFARSYPELAVLRFVASIGMGGVLPGSIAMLSEYVAPHRRARMIAVTTGCFTIGFAAAAVAASAIVPHHGWRPLFHVSYVAVAVAAAMLAWVPESPAYLVGRGRGQQALAVVERLYPTMIEARSADPETFFPRKPTGATRAPFTTLWRREYLARTVAITFLYLFVQFVIYAVGFWLVSLLVMHGFPLVSSYSYAIDQALAATVGGIVLGWVLDRSDKYVTLMIAFCLGSACLILFSLSSSLVVLYVLSTLVGFLVLGGQNTVHILVTDAYRPDVRATALGWALGIGRLGGLLGPLVGGYLLSLRLPYPVYFVAFAVPAVLASIVIAVLRVLDRRRLAAGAVATPVDSTRDVR